MSSGDKLRLIGRGLNLGRRRRVATLLEAFMSGSEVWR